MPKELILKQFDSEVKEIKGERALNVTITTILRKILSCLWHMITRACLSGRQAT